MEPIELHAGYTLRIIEDKGLGEEPLFALVRPDGSPARLGGPPPGCMSRDAVAAHLFALVEIDREMLRGRV